MTRSVALLPVLLSTAFVLAVAADARAADPLGRLFLTPEQREALDARRRARLPDKPATPTAVAPVSRVDGYVQRSAGRSTVWVNGQAISENTPEAPARVDRGARGVTLRLGEDGRGVRTQVGQSVDSATGEVRDPLGDGAVRVRPAAPPREARPR